MRILLLSVLALLATVTHAEDWMSRLNDDALLCDITIPGTHDAGTGNGFAPYCREEAEIIARTQDVSIAKQWQCGIRAFDLRPAIVEEDGQRHFHIFHGKMRTDITLDEVFRLFRDSLQAHPSEFIVIVMQHENSGDASNEAWDGMMSDYLTHSTIQPLIAEYHPFITVGELRGKILLLSRTHYAEKPVGSFVYDWTFKANLKSQKQAYIRSAKGEGSLYVQDYYKPTTKRKLRRECRSITRMLEQTVKDQGKGILHINHTSGYAMEEVINGNKTVTSNGYRYNASTTNPIVLQWITSQTTNVPAGIIMMDYTGVDVSGDYNVTGKTLTQELIAHNFRGK